MKTVIFLIFLTLSPVYLSAQSTIILRYKVNCYEDMIEYASGEAKVDALTGTAAMYVTKFGDIHKGIGYLLEARDISEETGYKEGLITTYQILGDIYLATRNYSTALDYYSKKTDLLQSGEAKEELFSSFLKMADVGLNSKNFEKALKYTYQALEYSNESDNHPLLPRAYYILALGYRGIFDYEKALYYINMSLSYAEKTGSVFFKGHSYNGIGDINEMMGNFETAFENYLKAEKIFKESNLTSGLTVVYFNLASMHKVFGRYEKALEYLKMSLKMSVDFKNDFMIRENYLGLYGIYNLLKDFEKANEYYMLLNSFSLEDSHIFIPLSKIEIDHEIAKKETDKELLRLKVERERNMRYIYAAVFTVLLLIIYMVFYRMLKQKRINELRLEERRIRAELSSLQFKINPHFLFNSISSISELINFDPDSAKKMLQNISNLLRYTLRTSKNDFVRLDEEIVMVEKYLEIEKIRFGKRLDYSLDIPDTLKNMQIPPLLIQPLVENSIKHGLSNRLEGGMVSVSVYEKIPGKVTITVQDNGVSKEGQGKPEGTGVGLSSVKDRLDLVYGSGHTFRIEKEKGFKVMIGIPKKI